MSNFSLFYSTTYVVVLQFFLTWTTSFLIIKSMVLAIHSTTLSPSVVLAGEMEPFVSWLLIKRPKVHSGQARRHSFHSLKSRGNSKNGLFQRHRQNLKIYPGIF